MSVNVYAPKSCDLSTRGFRWCNKDERWERRGSIDHDSAADLAEELGYEVELRAGDKQQFKAIPPKRSKR